MMTRSQIKQKLQQRPASVQYFELFAFILLLWSSGSFHDSSIRPASSALVNPITPSHDKGHSSTINKNKNVINIKVCQNKECCKHFPSKYDGGLIQTLQDLIVVVQGTSGAHGDAIAAGPSVSKAEESSNSIIVVESSGCLSQCSHGPNICVNDNRVFGNIDGTLAAAAVLEVVAPNIDCSGPLMAAIEDMATATKFNNDPHKKIKYLNTAIDSLENQGEATATSTAMAHALILRADAYMECIPPSTQEALDDAMHAIKLNDLKGRAWRVLADVKEAMGDIKGALDAVSKWAKKNPFFTAKAKKELDRLSQKKTR